MAIQILDKDIYIVGEGGERGERRGRERRKSRNANSTTAI
jgi:hypothetical protein